MRKITLFLVLAITLVGCNKPDLLNETTNSKNKEKCIILQDPDPYPHCENIPTFSRPLDSAEQLFYGSYFPLLDLEKSRITSISTKCYNCVAWTLGVTDAWIWPDGGHVLPTPESTRLEYFDEFYQNLGYVKTTDPNEADIEAWGIQPPGKTLYMTHASVVYRGSSSTISYTGAVSTTTSSTVSSTVSNTVWESKLGEFERITHGINELEGDTYGKVVVYYKKSNHMVDIQKLRKQFTIPVVSLTASQTAKLSSKIDGIDKTIIKEFNSNFDKWRKTWERDTILLSSNPFDRKQTTEYKRLLQMGDMVLPLVIERLYLHPEDFFGLLLYDDLQKDVNLRVVYDGLRDLQRLEGEQSRANRTILLYMESL